MATCVQKNASIQVFDVPKATCATLKMTLCEIDPRYFILLFMCVIHIVPIYINTTVCILNGHLHKSPNDAL